MNNVNSIDNFFTHILFSNIFNRKQNCSIRPINDFNLRESNKTIIKTLGEINDLLEIEGVLKLDNLTEIIELNDSLYDKVQPLKDIISFEERSQDFFFLSSFFKKVFPYIALIGFAWPFLYFFFFGSSSISVDYFLRLFLSAGCFIFPTSMFFLTIFSEVTKKTLTNIAIFSSFVFILIITPFTIILFL